MRGPPVRHADARGPAVRHAHARGPPERHAQAGSSSETLWRQSLRKRGRHQARQQPRASALQDALPAQDLHIATHLQYLEPLGVNCHLLLLLPDRCFQVHLAPASLQQTRSHEQCQHCQQQEPAKTCCRCLLGEYVADCLPNEAELLQFDCGLRELKLYTGRAVCD